MPHSSRTAAEFKGEIVRHEPILRQRWIGLATCCRTGRKREEDMPGKKNKSQEQNGSGKRRVRKKTSEEKEGESGKNLRDRIRHEEETAKQRCV